MRTTEAPMSARSMTQNGPGPMPASSTTRTPASGPGAASSGTGGLLHEQGAQPRLGDLVESRSCRSSTTRTSRGRRGPVSSAAQCSASAGPVQTECSATVTNATGTSPSMRSGRPTTATSRTPTTPRRTRSISGAPTFSPPTLRTSLSRSTKVSAPDSSQRTRSPVRNQPSSAKARAVASASPRYSANSETPRSPPTSSSPDSPGATGWSSTSTTATAYSGAGRPMVPSASGWARLPTTGWETVSVIPNQPTTGTPPVVADGARVALLPQPRYACRSGASWVASARTQNETTEVHVAAYRTETPQNREAENRGTRTT